MTKDQRPETRDLGGERPRARRSWVAIIPIFWVLLTGCGRDNSGNGGGSASAHAKDGPMAAELAATLEREKDFYLFKTPADLPSGLKWENSSDLPEFADVNAKKGGTLTYYIQDFPRTTRVIGPDATGGIRKYIWDYVEMYAAHQHPNFPGRVFPGFAREWATNTDRRTVYFRIHEKARWSDGHPFTTDDIVFSLYFLRSPHIRAPWYTDFHTKNWERLTVYDKHTYALTLKELRPDFLVRAGQAFYPFPKHALADFGPDYIEKHQWKPQPTLGGFTLLPENIEKGRGVTLTRVKDWWARDLPFWRGRYNPDRFRLLVIRDVDKAFESFLRGDLDALFLPMTNVPRYWYELLPDTHPDVAGGYIHKTKFFNQIPQPNWGLWMNRMKLLLDNRDIRIGIQHAANFKRVAEQYFRGDAVQMNTHSDGYHWRVHPTLTARPFDPVKAREYFAKAGFMEQGPDGILRNSAGQRLAVTLSTYRPDFKDIMTILKTEAAKAGIELNLEILDRTTGVKIAQEKNHQIGLHAFSRTAELFPRYWDFFHGANAYKDAYLGPDGTPVEKAEFGKPNPKPQQVRVQTNNLTQTFIPELDRLIEAYDKTTTLDELKPLAAQIEQMVHDDAAWAPGWSLPFYRLAYWRWVKWPEHFSAMQSLDAEEFSLYWIDPEVKQQTTAARRRGDKFPPQVRTFDQYRQK